MHRSAALAVILMAASMPAAFAAPEPAKWEFKPSVPGGPLCRAVKLDADVSAYVDTMLLRNRAGDMVLMAGHSTWRLTDGQATVTLSADGASPVELQGYIVDRIVLVLISDRALLQKVKDAKKLDWRFPWGDFSADVAGLGAAFDAIPICPG
jgi:CHASE2 domain-containing sensor protein